MLITSLVSSKFFPKYSSVFTCGVSVQNFTYFSEEGQTYKLDKFNLNALRIKEYNHVLPRKCQDLPH